MIDLMGNINLTSIVLILCVIAFVKFRTEYDPITISQLEKKIVVSIFLVSIATWVVTTFIWIWIR